MVHTDGTSSPNLYFAWKFSSVRPRKQSNAVLEGVINTAVDKTQQRPNSSRPSGNFIEVVCLPAEPLDGIFIYCYIHSAIGVVGKGVSLGSGAKTRTYVISLPVDINCTQG